MKQRQENQVQDMGSKVSPHGIRNVILAADTRSIHDLDELSIPVPPIPISLVAITYYICS